MRPSPISQARITAGGHPMPILVISPMGFEPETLWVIGCEGVNP